MSIELAVRLLASGSMSSAQAHAAIMQHTTRSIPLIRALRNAGVTAEAIEQETNRANVPRLRQVTPLLNVVSRLPKGMCIQLLAIPTRVDPLTSTVDVAMADPFDVHAQQEIAFHLEAPVRIVHASLSAVDLALIELTTSALGRMSRMRPPASFGYPGDRSEQGPLASPTDAPFPLLRNSSAPSGSIHTSGTTKLGPPQIDQTLIDRTMIATLPSTAPGDSSSFSELSPDSLDLSTIEYLHVVIPRNASLPRISDAPSGVAVDALFDASSEVAESGSMLSDVVGLDAVLDGLSRATDRDSIVAGAVRGMSCVAKRVGVFAARRDVFAGWACSQPSVSFGAFRAIRIMRHLDSVLAQAATRGWYFGPIPRDSVHQPLCAFVSRDIGDVMIVAVRIKGRAAMLIAGAELVDTPAATRAAEQIAHACAKALVRILRAEKVKLSSHDG